MPPKRKKTVQPAALLAASEQGIIDFLTDCQVSEPSGLQYDISRIADIDLLPAHERDALGIKLSSAMEKMNPLDTKRLDQLLGNIDVAAARDRAFSISSDQDDIDSDATELLPTPLTAAEKQDRDYAGLLNARGRPVMPREQLGPLSTMTKKDIASAAAWLDTSAKHYAADADILPVFTQQLWHWREFQRHWQWHNRETADEDTGFAAYLASEKEQLLEAGEMRMLADTASLERTTRHLWRSYRPQYLASSTETTTFDSYIRGMTKQLEARAFTRSFRLSKDPRKQDEWTTWVEYLYYIYWETDQDAARMRHAEPRYRRAMKDLANGKEYKRWFESDPEMPLQHQLAAVKDILMDQCNKLANMREDAQDYLKYEELVRRGERKAKWVLEELELIEQQSVEEQGKGREKKAEAVAGEKEKSSVADVEDAGKENKEGGASFRAVEDVAKSTNMHSSAAEKTNDGSNSQPIDSRQLRKRKRGECDEGIGAGTASGTQNGAAASSPLKRPRTRASSSIASTALAKLTTNARPKRKLRGG